MLLLTAAADASPPGLVAFLGLLLCFSVVLLVIPLMRLLRGNRPRRHRTVRLYGETKGRRPGRRR